MNFASERVGRTVVIVGSAWLLVLAMWVATQRHVLPATAASPRAFAAAAVIALDAASVIGLVWLAAMGYGFPLRRLMFPAMPHATLAQAGIGLATMLMTAWIVGHAGTLGPASGWIMAAVGWGLAVLQLAAVTVTHGAAMREKKIPLPWTLALGAIPLGLVLVAASCPPGTLWAVEAYGYDVTSYHLQLPREWMDAGRLGPLQHNVYSFLPGLMESGYAWLGTMRGSVLDAVYLAQLFHVSLAVYAAAAVGALVHRATGSATASVAAAAVLLALPWTTVTATLAYNEMAMLAFFAAALLLAFDPVSERWPGAAAAGVLLGAAILAKPTAAFMAAAPLGVCVLVRWNHVVPWRPAPSWGRAVGVAVVLTAATLVTVSPWLVRNHRATGNPLFPFACGVFGSGHWTPELVARWERAHGLQWTTGAGERASAMAGQWLFNAGYGAIGGGPVTREATSMAVFDTGGGFPLLWTFAAAGAVLGLRTRQTRGVVIALAAVVAMQVLFWAALTHLQSRFLLPTVVPGVALAGIALARLDAALSPRRWWLAPSLTVFLALSLAASSFNEFFAQIRSDFDPWDIVDSLARGAADHPLDDLTSADRGKILMVADAGGLLYIDPPIVYATAFDASPLGQILDQTDDVTASLQVRGITHVWVGLSELERLHATYGHDPRVTAAAVQALAAEQKWTPVRDLGVATLYVLP